MKTTVLLLATLVLLSPMANAQPAYNSLGALPGTMEGDLLMASNNPESVNRSGLLLSTDAMSNPSDPQRRTHNNINYGQGCAPGTLKDFAFYMHHINILGANARYWVLIEPGVAGTSVTFNAYGAAISQRDTGSIDPGFGPSYKVSESLILGRLASNVSTAAGSGFVNLQGKVIGSAFPLVNLQADANSSIDARIKIRAQSCVRVKVVAASPTEAVASTTETALQKAIKLSTTKYAWGNVASSPSVQGGAPCTDAASIGWGRSAGVYKFERWAGSTNVSINTADSTQGWKFLAAPANQEVNGVCGMVPFVPTPSSDSQRSVAVGYYHKNLATDTEGRDSDPWTTGNYGAEYKLGFSITNRSGRCVRAQLQLRSYPGGNSCSTVQNPKTRNYDGAFRVTQNGVASTTPVRVATRCPAGNGLPEMAPIATKIMQVGETLRWDIQTFIPGLISIPGGILLESKTATCP